MFFYMIVPKILIYTIKMYSNYRGLFDYFHDPLHIHVVVRGIVWLVVLLMYGDKPVSGDQDVMFEALLFAHMRRLGVRLLGCAC